VEEEGVRGGAGEPGMGVRLGLAPAFWGVAATAAVPLFVMGLGGELAMLLELGPTICSSCCKLEGAPECVCC